MRKKLIIPLIITIFLCSGCKQEPEVLNEFKIENSNSISYISDNELSYAKGFASDIAVVAANAADSADSNKVYAEAALLVDITTNEVLFQKNVHSKVYPASTTKCLTALLAIKYGDTTSTRVVGDEIYFYEDNVVICDYRVGDIVSFDTALHGSLIKSGNDAASVLALFAADSIEEFAELMNNEAYSLGATNSHFVNAHGLYNDNHYTTAYDMYLIFKEAVKSDYLVSALSAKSHVSTLKRTTPYNTYDIECSYTTTNPFFTGLATAPEHVEVICGKSGYTEVARRSYVLLAEGDNGHQYIALVMKDDNYDYMCADLTYLVSLIPE